MSTLAAHAALGLLLGLAMRVKPRLLPLVPVIAVLPDLDHLARYLDLPGLHLRMTFHNVFFAVLLPLLVYAALARLDAPREWQELAGKSPAILTAGLVADVVAVEPAGTLGAVALFWPVDDRWWSVPQKDPTLYDPTAFGSVSLVLVVLCLLAVVTWAWFEYVAGPANVRTARERWRRVGAYALAWLLLFPMLAAAGLVTVSPREPGPRLDATAPWADGPGLEAPLASQAAPGDPAPDPGAAPALPASIPALEGSWTPLSPVVVPEP